MSPKGALSLDFARAPGGQTFLQRQYASYPFHICRVRHIDAAPAGMATLYLQTSAGGLFADDRLSTSITAAAHSAAHVTTQASTIVHRMDRANSYARHQVDIEAGDRAFLEYLSDPTILFPQAALESHLRVSWQPTATVIIGDAFLSHDPNGRDKRKPEPFRWLDSELRVESPTAELLAADRFRASGDDFIDNRPGACSSFRTLGSLLVLTREPASELISALRSALRPLAGCYAGVSALPNDCGVWLRILAVDGATIRAAMLTAWGTARTQLTGQPPPPRRK